MSGPVQFVVVGIPKPQGSKKAYADQQGNVRMTESGGLAFAQWRNAVSAEAKDVAEARGGGFDEAVEVSMSFMFAMPKSRPKKVRAAGVAPMTVAPDIDKLARAVLDAMQAAGLIKNDSQVTDLRARKVEAVDGWVGASIVVGPLSGWPAVTEIGATG